jgi:hypothetical protein
MPLNEAFVTFAAEGDRHGGVLFVGTIPASHDGQ